MKQLEAIKLHTRLLARDMIWAVANRHHQGTRPNIAVFGSRRSGSTLLMQVISANRGVKSVDQPCCIFSASAYQVRQLPIRDCGQLHQLDDQEQQMIRTYFYAITAGSLHVNEPWRIWSPDYDWISDRIVFKFTDAHGSAEWLSDTFGWQTVVLIRHPLAQSLSVLNLKDDPGGWHSRAPGFFRNRDYCRTYLDPRKTALAYDVWARGDELERHILGWVLENLPLVKALERRVTWSFVSYEALVLAPEAVVRGLAPALDLRAEERMLNTMKRESRSVRRLSQLDRRTAIRQGDRASLLSSWRRQIGPREEERLFSLIYSFGVDLYQAGRDAPTELMRFPAAEQVGSSAISSA